MLSEINNTLDLLEETSHLSFFQLRHGNNLQILIIDVLFEKLPFLMLQEFSWLDYTSFLAVVFQAFMLPFLLISNGSKIF